MVASYDSWIHLNSSIKENQIIYRAGADLKMKEGETVVAEDTVRAASKRLSSAQAPARVCEQLMPLQALSPANLSPWRKRPRRPNTGEAPRAQSTPQTPSEEGLRQALPTPRS